MSARTPAERQLISRIANGVRWSSEADRTAATALARAAFDARFEDEIDPDRQLPPEELAKRVRSARSAYFAKLSLAARKSRKANTAARAAAKTAGTS